MQIIIKDILHNMQIGKCDVIFVEFLFHIKKHFNSFHFREKRTCLKFDIISVKVFIMKFQN